MLMLAALLATASAAPKPAALKWSQFLDGSVTAVFQLKRGASELCTGETALVEDLGMRLIYRMTCSGELYELNVVLPKAVITERTTVKRIRAEAHVTLHKEDPGIWWSSLARHPEMYKTLVQRDTQRGDLEPDEDELAEAAAKVRATRAGSKARQEQMQGQQPQVASVDAASGGATSLSGKAKEEAAMRQAKLEQDIEEALTDASEELKPEGSVAPQTVSKLKALRQAVPKNGRVALVLAYLMLKRGDRAKFVIPLLRDAIKLEPDQPGAHQQLAQLLTKGMEKGEGDSAAVAQEAAELYFKGSLLLPTDAETYYQLGRYLQMVKGGESWPTGQGKVGGKRGKRPKGSSAVAGLDRPPGSANGRGDVFAWRSAIKLKPDMAEAMQMLSMRLARSATRKKDRESARRLASKALKLEPNLPVSYVTVGVAAAPHTDKLKEANREKAMAAFQTALEMHEKRIGGGLSTPRHAETMHHLGMLYASKKNPSSADGSEALRLFRGAAEIMPSEPKYSEAVEQLKGGIASYNHGLRERERREAETRLKQLQEEEDAAYEEDEKEEGFSSIR